MGGEEGGEGQRYGRGLWPVLSFPYSFYLLDKMRARRSVYINVIGEPSVWL